MSCYSSLACFFRASSARFRSVISLTTACRPPDSIGDSNTSTEREVPSLRTKLRSNRETPDCSVSTGMLYSESSCGANPV
jgi:hypothetical protein